MSSNPRSPSRFLLAVLALTTLTPTLAAQAPANDDCADAPLIGFGTVSGDTSAATLDGAARCGFEPSSDVWFRFRSLVAIDVAADTRGSDFDTVLSVHLGCPGTPANAIACNDDAFWIRSAVDFRALPSVDYYLRVAGSFGDAGRFDLTIGESGVIAGTVSDAQSGEPLAGILVRAFPTIGEDPVSLAHTGADGGYRLEGLPADTYVVSTIDLNGPYLREIYDDLPCDLYLDCDPPDGTPVEVVAGETTAGIDFTLEREGIVSGTVDDAATGAPIHDLVEVLVFDAEGREVGAVYPRMGGYAVGGLYGGTYFVTAENPRYLAELYDGIPCPRGVLYGGCDPRDGTPVAVAAGDNPGIDFSLERRGAITGTVTAAGSGLPIALPRVEVWSEQGSAVAAGPTDDAGFYDLGGLDAGTYFVRTRNFGGYLDEVYDDVPCGEECDPTIGTPIAVGEDATVTGIDFALGRPPCVPADTVLCLDRRFRVEARWQDFEGNTGPGFVRPLTEDTGAFWFFAPENLELMVKVLDACGLPGFDNFWVFAGGLTNVEVILRVTDAESGEVQVYFNPMGSAFQPIQDTGSFRTCP